MKSYRRHNGPACAQPAHDVIRATTETAPEGYHFNCEWPFPE